MATDIPALWNAPQAAPADRQVILRHLIDRIVVNVHRDTEVVDVTIHWAGGLSSQHEVIRPVRRYHQLHDFDLLKARIVELRQARCNSQQIASQLNREGFRPPRRATRYNGEMVRQFLSRYLGETSRNASHVVEAPLDLLDNEWRLNGLAQALSIPKPTLYGWLRRGWVHARKASTIGGCHWVIWADAEERERLGRLYACPLGVAKLEHAPELTVPKPRAEP